MGEISGKDLLGVIKRQNASVLLKILNSKS